MAGFLVSTVLEQLSSISVDKLFSTKVEKVAEALKLLPGLDDEVKALTSNLEAIRAVIEDAEKRQVNDSAIKLWLSNLKDVSYDIDDVLDEWNIAILKIETEKQETRSVEHAPLSKKRKLVSYLLSLPSSITTSLVLRRDIANKIKELNERLDEIANQSYRYQFKSERASLEERIITTSIIDEFEVFGRDGEKEKIKDMLCHENSQETNTLRVISMVGMGGLGKTTLTRLAYNDPEVISHFDKRIWVCVSDPFEEERIAIEILESLDGQKPDLVGRDNILREISTRVSGKKILLVLDDVWTEDSTKWEQLKGSLNTSSPGSRILVTTRNEMVGSAMGSRKIDMFFLGKLSGDKCWSLFCHRAFFERRREECESLEETGRKIVERCKGLPLAVKVVGGLLGSKKTKEQWQSILGSEMWEIEDVEKHVFPPLLLSYYDLPPVLRQCFSYCAMFPKDYRIWKQELIRLWMVQGFVKELEITGEEYFNKLAMHSFFQDFEKCENGNITYCKMHDMVHDFAQFLTKKECLLIDIDSLKEPWKNPSFKTIRHVMVEWEATFPIPVNNNWGKLRSLVPKMANGKLRTLWPNMSNSSMSNFLNSIDHLTCLRAFDLSYHLHSTVMPTDKIGKLIHLRYLNLSYNDLMRKLPEAVCDLYNLQILDITECTELTELPHGIGKLNNLVYLENTSTSVRFMPKGMERLTLLRTLGEFAVSSDDSKSKSCGLKYLGKLIHLRRYLKIRGLGNVEEVREAREAQLSAKTGLQQLILEFDSDEMRQIRMEDEACILEALQPPPTLESLRIRDVKGPTLCPSWIASLTMLKSVSLSGCDNLESLPPMGKLPSLEYLFISGMGKVKKVGEEFLGIEREEGQASSSTPTSNHNVAFPSLKRLVFYRLGNWEEWELYGDLSTSKRGQDSSSCITIMPRLHFLRIGQCSKLKALPHHLLQNTAIVMDIYDCPILEGRSGEK